MESLKIEFLSDWHIGSGTGRPGDVDRLVRRDQDGLPYLPAKSIVGIWRDACEMVAEALDNREAWKAWVDYLFGSQPGIAKVSSPEIQTRPKPAALSLRSAHMPDPIVKALQHKPALQAAMTFVKPGIKIDDRSGYVKKDYLRFEEVARTGLTLTTDFEINGVEKGTSEYKTAIALLSAGAAFIHRIGGKRRRGMGRCHVEIEGYSANTAAEWIEKNTPTPVDAIKPPSNQASQPTTDRVSAQQKEWHCFDLMITAEQPLILSKRTVGNLVETLDYIPATYLLPIVLKSWQGINVGDAIAQGDFLITNATLLTEGVAGRPAPFVLFEEKQKDEGATIDKFYNRFQASGERQLKQCRQGYLGDTLPVQTVDRQVETHNTIDDVVQRPTSDVGGVYTYEAIAPKTQLVAQLRIRDRLFQQLNSDWQTKLSGASYVGRTKKDEYGKIGIAINEPKPEASDTQKPDGKISSTKELTVWLLSDVLLRDDWLQPTNDVEVLIKLLESRLKVSLTPWKQNDDPYLFARQRRTESWQTRWGLPRPSLVGLSAGSCLRLEVVGELSLELCRDVERSGVGERCVEGYGQILLNAPLLNRDVIDVLKPDPNSDISEPKDVRVPHAGEILQYAHFIEKAAWREAIRQSVQIIAGNKDVREKEFHLSIAEGRSKPSLSQLGGLRSQAMQLKPGDNRLYTWLEALKADGKWSNETADAFIGLLESEAIWRRLDFEKTLKLTYGKLTLSQGGEATLRNELWAEALQSFIVALTRAHKREVEGSTKEAGQKGGENNG
jgi:CRISPR-associated protein Csx10